MDRFFIIKFRPLAIICISVLWFISSLLPVSALPVAYLDLTGVSGDAGDTTSVNVIMPNDAIEAVTFSFQLTTFDTSQLSDVSIRILDSSGSVVIPSFYPFLDEDAVGTSSFSQRFPLSPAVTSPGSWTMEVNDNVSDSPNPEYSFISGMVVFDAPDTKKPVIAVIANTTVATAPPGANTASVSFTTTVSDNDPAGSFTPVFTVDGSAITSPHIFPVGVTTVTVTANNDPSGNAPESITFTVTVTDGDAPVFMGVPADISQSTDEGLGTAVVSFTAPTATDYVDGSITPVLVTSPMAGLTSGAAFPLGVTTVTYTATDAANNMQTASFTVTVTDGEAPVFAGVPADISQSTDEGSDTAVVSFTAPTATDNVDGSITPVLVTSPTAGLTSGAAFPLGVTTVTYTATDAAGNVQTASFTVTVGDGEAPVFADVPADISQSTDAGSDTAVVSFTAPTATDNAGGSITPVLVTSPTAGLTSGAAFPLGVTTVTYTATDAANNMQTASFTVTVGDGEAPVFAGVPADISQSTDEGSDTAVVSFTAPTATDNVDGSITPVLVTSPTAGLTSGAAFPLGVTTVTYTATDAAGNVQTASFTVTVGDTGKPVFTTFPSGITLSVDFPTTTAAASWIEPTATDNASGIIAIIQTAGPASGSAFPIGTTTVTYTATDVADNVTTLSFTVTVTAIPPGTVTFVVNSGADGTYNIQSLEPVLNIAIVASSGIGRSPAIALRPGVFPVTFTVPNGIGVESAQCSTQSSTLSAETLSGTIIITSGTALTCTIKTRDSLREPVAQIGQFLESRSQD